MVTLKEAIDQEFKHVSRAEVNQIGSSLQQHESDNYQLKENYSPNDILKPNT